MGLMRFDFTERTAQRFISECGFTDEEKEVFTLVRRGWQYSRIADEIYVSEITVKRRVRSIKDKILRTISEE